MQFHINTIEIPLIKPLIMSTARLDTSPHAVVQVQDGDYMGQGAAVPFTGNGETRAGLLERIRDLCEIASRHEDSLAIEAIHRDWRALPGYPAARCAVDIALHDLAARRSGLPLHAFLGLTGLGRPATSFTVGLGETESMIREARTAAERFPALKVKLGMGARGVEAVLRIREALPEVAIRVDANGGWTPREAVEYLHRLEPARLELVEQPVPPGSPEALRFVRERVGVPIFADESVRSAADVLALAGCVDGVNLKLLKCGGIRPTLAAAQVARACGLSVMLGCMAEGAVGIAAAAHIAGIADLVDLDGILLLRDDPWGGVRFHNGVVEPPEGPGLGLQIL